jgi:capping protein beta
MGGQTEQTLPLSTAAPMAHIENLGHMVEEMDGKLRSSLQDLYFGKTRDIVNDLRSPLDLAEMRKQAELQSELIGKLKAR